MLFFILPSSSAVWLLAAPLAICANVGFGASVVALNSYIPSLARGAPEVVTARVALARAKDVRSQFEQEPQHEDEEADDEPLLSHTAPMDADVIAATFVHEHALSTATARISAQGIALGYAAGILMLLLALIPVTALGGSTFALRLAIGLSGVWWAVFSLPAARWLPGAAETKDTTIEVGEYTEERQKPWNMWEEIVGAWRRLGGMLRLREIRRLKNTFKYLAAWFLLSDG